MRYDPAESDAVRRERVALRVAALNYADVRERGFDSDSERIFVREKALHELTRAALVFAQACRDEGIE